MKDALLDILVCPDCRSSLDLSEVGKEVQENGVRVVIEGSLVCTACSGKFDIAGGIPDLLPKGRS